MMIRHLCVHMVLLITTVVALAVGGQHALSEKAPFGAAERGLFAENHRCLQEGRTDEECSEITTGQRIMVARILGDESCETLPMSFKKIAFNRALDYRLEPLLVNALITIESNWNPRAKSRSGAMGLMQLMPATAREMGVRDPFDPAENIEGGVKYLRYLLDRFDGDLVLAVAAYNAGPTRIETYQGIPPIRETQQYVSRVLNLYNGYRTDSI